MAAKMSKRITRAVNEALLERDRVEMRAIDALLSVVKPSRRRKKRRPRR